MTEKFENTKNSVFNSYNAFIEIKTFIVQNKLK